MTDWGVWPSSENWHLYYRLRESYGERRMLCETPGHLFLAHEKADLATFIQLATLFGWDFYLLPAPAYSRVFVSHDEFLQLYTDSEAAAKEAQQALDGAECGFRGMAISVPN